MSAGQQIDYELLAQDAMRGVVREVLRKVATDGLPGDHHFYIAFNMRAPGVSVSKRLREKYPEEMTIVLQHRFWDLIVEDERFEVKLTFDAIPERLCIPFKAVKVFLDPSVQYGLQFGDAEPAGSEAVVGDAEAATAHGQAATGDASPSQERNGAGPATRPGAERRRPARKPRADRAADARPAEPVVPAAVVSRPAPEKREPAAAKDVKSPPAALAPTVPAASVEPAVASPAAATRPDAAAQGADAKVVRLDVFRNKSK